MKQQCFSSLKYQKKQFVNFHKILWESYKMETQKIITFLNDSSNEESKFATNMWYVIDSQTKKGKYKQGNTIKFETESIKSSLCDYSDVFVLVTGNITVNEGNDILHLKIVHHFLHARQKLMMCLLTKQIIKWLNMVIVIQINRKVYGSLNEMNLQLIILNRLNIKQLF